ncbi:hypothetical protein [Stenotrophomonas sp. PS02300]|uniref:hypothetical protein n=1 Tax=Stenotrophomonas sp. PS02300 TaxID=2991426 RepID=UPI00249AF386|nr:hypothetical protein [Stenotrophomonas sp. PS02300]
MDRLRHDVDQLIETPFDDIAAVDALLGSQLGPVGSDDQLNVRKADAGAIAGISLRSIELRSARDDPRHATLLMSVEPSALMMTDAPWPAAVLYPPRPDAPDSNAYWSLQTGGATVIVGLGPDQVHVSYVSISKR